MSGQVANWTVHFCHFLSSFDDVPHLHSLGLTCFKPWYIGAKGGAVNTRTTGALSAMQEVSSKQNNSEESRVKKKQKGFKPHQKPLYKQYIFTVQYIIF